MGSFINGYEIPEGMGMALSMDAAAMERFASLSAAEKKSVVEGAKNMRSSREMRDYVNRLAQGSSGATLS